MAKRKSVKKTVNEVVPGTPDDTGPVVVVSVTKDDFKARYVELGVDPPDDTMLDEMLAEGIVFELHGPFRAPHFNATNWHAPE